MASARITSADFLRQLSPRHSQPVWRCVETAAVSKPLTASVTPLHSAASASEKPRRAQCDRDVKLHISEAVYDDLARVARADPRPVSETIRVLLERHRYGAARAGG